MKRLLIPAVLLLAACGGGGGSSPSMAATTVAAGTTATDPATTVTPSTTEAPTTTHAPTMTTTPIPREALLAAKKCLDAADNVIVWMQSDPSVGDEAAAACDEARLQLSIEKGTKAAKAAYDIAGIGLVIGLAKLDIITGDLTQQKAADSQAQIDEAIASVEKTLGL